MRICYKALAALLAAFMLLAALAACANDEQAAENEPPPNEEFAFLQGRQITQADVDFTLRGMRFVNENATETEALTALVYQKVYVWEAESLDLLPSLEEAERQVQESYNMIKEAVVVEAAQQLHGAQEAWQAMQDFMQYMGIDEDKYLTSAAEVWQSNTARSSLLEQLYDSLPPDANELERAEAQGEYGNSLIAKYRDYLVEDDLEPLLEEVLSNELSND